MTVRQAKEIARRWVAAEAAQIAGFRGAFFHGSINYLPDDATLAATSDVDVMVVLDAGDLPPKPGKFVYRGVVLEVSYVPVDELRSPEMVLSVSHLAGSLRAPSIILDPTGQLTRLHETVSRDFAKHRWVYERCEHAAGKILANLASLDEAKPFHDQVLAWLFGTGVTTHILLVAGRKNPSVRRRYVAVRELLAEYGHSSFYETLLEMLGCARMSRARVEEHLSAVTEAFDVAKTVIRTPLIFTSDISDAGRPAAIDGSRELIESGYHREAVFWLAVTYSRCQKVLYLDAPGEVRKRFTPGYRRLLADLGIASFVDLQRRGKEVIEILPSIREVAEAIIAANPEIED